MKDVKKNRASNFPLLEQGLEKFYEACVAKEFRALSYDMMITQAQKIGEELIAQSMVEKEHLPGTDAAWKSFVQRFLAKRSIKSRKLHGEAADTDVAAAEHFMSNDWPALFASVDMDKSRVWNMDETGLVWRALPPRTLARADKRLAGGKTQKDRITFAVAVSMAGEKLYLHGIGNSKNPRAIAAVNSTPANVLRGRWNSNPKAWMNTEVFCEWLLDLNRRFRGQNKKMILLVDNCPGHKTGPVDDQLDFVRVVFLPKNTTSEIQPCDAGIIQAFKTAYRRFMLRKVNQFVEDPALPKLDSSTLKANINLLHCLQFAKSAWDNMTAQTIVNCWRKAGYVPAAAAAADATDADACAVEVVVTADEDTEDISELNRLDSSEPCREVPSDNPQSIVADLQAAADTSQQESDDEDDNSTTEPPPSTAAVMHTVDTLRRSLYASNADTSMHATFSKVENFLTAKRASRCRQATITDMFSK